MNFMMTYLSQIAGAVSDSGVSGALLLKIIGAIFSGLALLLGGGFLGKKQGKAQAQAEAQQIGPQPFMVKMADEFVTRREFVELKSEIRNDVTEMKGLFRETMLKIDAQNTNLTEAIEDGIKEGRLGRVAIWNEVNPQGKKLAAVEAKQDVAEQIGKLADAIKGNGKNTTGR